MRYFEDFQIGEEFATGGRTITETDIVNFAGVSGDFNAIHIDAEHSKKAQFGQRIAHGLLGLSVVSGLCAQLGMFETVVAFLGLEWKFKNIIHIGDTISVRLKVDKTRSVGANGMVILSLQVVNQNNETVQEGTWNLFFKKRA